tara:strand:- start:282 stop:2132 length:1851 start_codon:yes stop_codon:yes gene_type:complete
MSISTTRTLPSSDTKNSFKAKLREAKPYFSSPILAGRIEEIEPILVAKSTATGISSNAPVSVRLFDYDEVVGIGTTSGDLSNAENKLIYFPGLEGDRVIVRVGVETATIDFVYANAVTVNGNDLTLDNSFTLGGQEFYIRGAGGALIQNGGGAPTYSVGVSTTNVNEGQSVEFTVNTANVSAGSTLFFSSGGTAVAADFTDNSLTGSFIVSATGITTFTRTLVAEGGTGTEGTENFNITIRTDSTSGAAVTTTPTITINDIVPSYNFVLTNQSGIVTNIAEEGELVTVTLNTTNIATGTEFRVWFDEEPGTNSDKDYRDFGFYNEQQDRLDTGNVETITIAGAATTFRIGAANDFRENENDTFRIILRERTASSSGVALTFATLQVTDVNLLFDITTDKTLVNEGDELTVTIGNPRHPVTGIGTYMPRGPIRATLEPVSGTFPIVNNAPGDFSSGWGDLKALVQTGYHSGYGNTSTFTIPIYADFTSEGLETFYVAFRADSYTNPVFARTADITINDTSTVPGTNANGLTFGPVIVNRDSGVVANATDWYKICKIDDLPEGSSIALFIDTSGSMNMSTIQASYDAFVAKLNEKNITITTVTNNSEDWITPFLVDLP